MNTKTIDCTGSNPRPIPVPLDGSPKTRPLRSALLPTLVFGSLSMLAAFFPGASSAQQPKPAVECIADIPTDHIGDWENECDDELVFKGSSTRSVASFSSCQDRSGSAHEIAKDETYTTATGDNPQTLCVQYKSAATQYSSGYAACVIASGNCDVDDDDDGVDYITAAELPEATINMTNAVIDEGSTATMTVSLNFTDSQASISSDVVLDITSGAATKVSVSPTTLTFTNANKSTPQQITLSRCKTAI
ncbi:MAG: hypothetical protein ISN28_01805 [Ectothiorhodospiraceae bacterium AqS1]|nr:hypothetical protein [Ectothiorhodospiraceae bacterium AqS1]